MFFFIAGTTTKLLGTANVKIPKNGFQVNGIVKVYRQYISLFFVPVIPLSKKYSLYIPHSDAYFEQDHFSKMPAEYLEICKEAGRLF